MKRVIVASNKNFIVLLDPFNTIAHHSHTGSIYNIVVKGFPYEPGGVTIEITEVIVGL